MYKRNINIKPKCGQQTGKALSNHERFSPSQSHETVPLKAVDFKRLRTLNSYIIKKVVNK
jgi:hypothetical protein